MSPRARLADWLQRLAWDLATPRGRERHRTRHDGLIETIVIGLILSAVLLTLSELLRPKPKIENARPAKLGDFRFPTAIEGRVVPVIWGTVKVDGPNVVWYGDLRQTKISQRIKTGLFSSKRIITGFRYNVGIQFGLCRGPVDKCKRVWIGDTVVATPSSADGPVTITNLKLFGGDDFGSGGVDGVLRFHPGSETQVVNSYLAPFQSPLPAYRGTCYAVWEGGYIGNSTTIKPWKFELQRLPNQLGLTSNHHIVNTDDANPAAVLYEILTDSDWGFGFPATDIDLPNFRAAGDTLFTEGNGFSLQLDNPREAADLLHELERQIDGVVYLDQQTGKFKINLARGGYDIDAVFQLNTTNTGEVKEYSRGTWEETANQVRVGFSDRSRDYFETFAQAHDLANQRIQGGELVSVSPDYPGVKDKALANQIASREIKALAIPLAKATVETDRTAWSLKPADVVAWTDANLGFTKLPMRVNEVDLGRLDEGIITLTLVQDVFGFAAGFFGAPDVSGWAAPVQDVAAIPSNEQVVIEAPKAFCDRDDQFPGLYDRIWAGARAQTGREIACTIRQRNSSGTPSGAFVESGDFVGFFLIGTLKDALTVAGANPGTIGLEPSPDSLSVLKAAFTNPSTPQDVGRNLVNLILIDDEFIGVTAFTDQTTYVDLTGSYRGMLDTVPAAHVDASRVYLVFVSGGITRDTIPPTNNVHVKLVPESATSELAEGSATQVSLTMANRARKPYPPAELFVNTSRFPSSVNLDTLRTGGTGLDDRGLELDYTRRDFRTTDEVASILTDAGTLDPTFPAANSTKYRAVVTEDADGSPAVLVTTAYNNGEAEIFVSRTLLYRQSGGNKPTSTLLAEVEAQHVQDGQTLAAIRKLRHEMTVAASTTDDDHSWGNLAPNTISSTYTAPTTGTYGFEIGTAFATGIVEARINGGLFVTVIVAGNTTGSLIGVIANDTIEVRHTQTGGAVAQTWLQVDAPTSTVDAYAILTT